MATNAEKLRELSRQATETAMECAKRGDVEGDFYARGLSDAYATAAAHWSSYGYLAAAEPQSLDPDLLPDLIMAAGELWHSTDGADPHDVLSVKQRAALDQAAALFTARVGG
jgi:hypothetical protein